MRVLFVPGHRQGAIAHGIPLLALSRQLEASFASAFLLPRAFWEFFRQRGANVLNIDHDELKTQMVARAQFKPDVVVDDVSISTAFAHMLAPFPRVTMQRTGSFPGEAAPAPGSEHSSDEGLRSLPDLSWMGLPKSPRLADLVKAEAIIIPGIRSVEVLPAALQNDPGYFYAGPLVGEDAPSNNLDEVDAFLQKHATRRIVLFTFGTIARAPGHVKSRICRLLEQGIAVLSTVPIEGLARDRDGLFLHREFLPLHRICARASLMIHQCGSGTSQYPILYNLPSITFSTGCYDRDDVALRLQSLGASVHFDGTAEPSGYDSHFDEAVHAYLDAANPLTQSARAVLSQLKQEAQQTAASFDFSRVLQHAIDARAGGRAKAGFGSKHKVPAPALGRRG